MELGLAGKAAIVTGGSKGIGFATAMLLAGEGAEVTIVASEPESLKEAAGKIKEQTGKSVLAISADVSVSGEADRVVDETVRSFGRVDILVNNAGTAAASARFRK